MIKNKVKERLNATLQQEMEKVDITTLFASLRLVRISGVPNPSGSILSKIKEGMRVRCKARYSRMLSMRGCLKTLKSI
jgi:hypothetical protein